MKKIESSWVLGVDLGQVQDHTALCVLERCLWESSIRDKATWSYPQHETLDVRKIERLPLGLPYPEIARRVLGLVTRVQRIAYYGQETPKVELVVDGTGVGAAVIDMLGIAGGAHLVAVTISASGQATRKGTRPGGEKWTVPKADLVGTVATALQSGELRISGALPEAHDLTRELLAMRAKISEAGRATWEAEAGSHDDLVLAVALAVWRARLPVPDIGFRRDILPGAPLRTR
jgi:hypothetical protein